VEHRQVEDRPATPYRGSGDDPGRFLRELRQLRDGAGLGQAELAARAHYPYDRIKAAEVGPTLPDLPVLSAYVRGCGGTTEEWEERWRSLTSAPTLPLLGTRPAGCSTAASAGARVGSVSPAADTPDPSVILAALDRVAEEMAVGTPSPAPLPSRAGVSTIEQRPAIPVQPPAVAASATASTASAAAAAAAAAAPAVKSAGAKAGTGKVTAWETTTMRTAWSSAAGSTTQEAGQAAGAGGGGAAAASTAAGAGTGTAAGAGTGTAAGAGTTAAEGARTAATRAGAAGYSAATLGETRPGGGSGRSGRSGGSSEAGAVGESAATRTVVGAGARSTAGVDAIAVRWRPRGLSRTTAVALIAIAFCVLVALLAVFA
jgi:Helix-turn-helix domain